MFRPASRAVVATVLLVVAACSEPTVPDLRITPALAKGAGGGTSPAITPNLSGHWKQTNLIHVITTLGSTDYWYEMDVSQSGGTLSGSAVQHTNTFNPDGSPWLVDFTGSPGKISGSVKADSTASIVFDRIAETKVTLSYVVKLSTAGTLLVSKPTATGPRSFVR